MGQQSKFSAVIMRGGSSKAVFLREEEMPKTEQQRVQLILSVFGSPDRRQIDGLGGADYLTSKCAIIGRPTRDDADIDYTFGQVSIVNPMVSFEINCGNISSAAALYAVEEGFVKLTEPTTLVRVHHTNTGRILRIKVPVADGAPVIEGEFAVDGVPGTGAPIEIDFSDSAGATTGKLLPTGSVRDVVKLRTGKQKLEVSIVDVGNPYIFFRAKDIGLRGIELPGEFSQATLDLLEDIRLRGAEIAGIASPVLPLPVIVGEPQDYETLVPGRTVMADHCDLVARMFCEQMPHKAYAGTGATCLAVAARISGTIAHEVSRKTNNNQVRIGHPSGVMPLVVDVASGANGWRVNEVVYIRTARRLMEGSTYVRKSQLIS